MFVFEIMGELIARALHELKPKKPIVLSTRALRPDMNPRERLGLESIPTRVEITPETRTKLKEARQIMGGRLILPGKVESALGTRIDQRFINDFPFTSEQMMALRHDSAIMYFADETDKRAPITMCLIDKKNRQKMKKLIKAMMPKKGDAFSGWREIMEYSGRVIEDFLDHDPLNKRTGQKFYESETPRPGWRSVTLDIVPGTQDQDALGQMRTLINYLRSDDKKVLGSSEKIVAAIEEFDHQEQALSHLIPFYPEEGAQRLTELAIAKLTMPTAVELAYVNVVLAASSDRKVTENCYSATQNRDSDFEREIIQIRNGGRDRGIPGVRRDDIFGMNPNRYYSDHGVVLSLGADALPTPLQPEEPKVSANEVKKPLLIPFITVMKEVSKPSDLPFDPERDITDIDWKGMVEVLARQREIIDKGEPNYKRYLQLTTAMEALSPKRFKMIHSSLLPKDEDFKSAIVHQEKAFWPDILEFTGRFNYSHQFFTETCVLLRKAFPDKAQPWDEKELKQAFEKAIIYERGEGKYQLKVLARLNILYPNWVSDRFLDEHNIKRENVQGTINLKQDVSNIDKIMEDEANFRILTGDNNHRLDWDIVKQAMSIARAEGNIFKLAKLCEMAMILSAEEVKISDRGLEINMRKPEKTPALTSKPESQQQSDLPFDPDKDIGYAEIEWLKEKLKAYGLNGSHIDFAAHMTIFSPRTLSEIYGNFTMSSDAVRNGLYERSLFINAYEESELGFSGRSGLTKIAQRTVALKMLAPDDAKKFELSKSLRRDMVREMEQITSKRSLAHNLELFYYMNILYPGTVRDMFGHMLNRESIEACRDSYKILPERNKAERHVENEAFFKILSQDYDGHVNWDLVRLALNEARTDNAYAKYAKFAAYATILAAQEVRVTDRGLEINMRKPEQKTVPAILTDRKADAEPIFDPERDIPEEDRENIFKTFQAQREIRSSVNNSNIVSDFVKHNRTSEYAIGAIAIMRLFPERYRKLQKEQKPDKDDYYTLLNMAGIETKYAWDDYLISDSPFREVTEAASMIRNLFGKKRSHGLGEKKDDIERKVKEDLTSGQPFNHLREYANLNIIYPNWITQNYSEHFTLERLQQRWSKVDQKVANIGFMLRDEANFRIITGRQFHFVDRNLIQREIQWAREKKKYDYLASLYESLLISTAEEVRVTDRGLVVNPRKPIEDKSSLTRYSHNWTM